MATDLKREAGGALPPLNHEVCPSDAPELREYSVEIVIRRGPAPEPPSDDEDVLVWFSEDTEAPTFVQAVPGIGKALGRKWDAVIERAHVIEADE